MEDLAEVFESYVQAWVKQDIDAIMEYESDACGFGFRDRDVRVIESMGQHYRSLVEGFFEILESYEFIPIDIQSRTIDNIGIQWGFFTEKLLFKNGEKKTINGRITHTWVNSGGKWKLILFHRDIQEF